MRYLFTLLFLFNVAFAQNSWVNVQLFTDNYSQETSWTITPPGGSPIIAQSDSSLTSLTLYSDTILLGGDIVVSLLDSYGDGLGASQWNGVDGWFLVQNDCQDTILYVAGNFGYSYIDTLTIAPCAPPVLIYGCTDTTATNYNPLANVDDTSCIYPPCDGLLTYTASQTCLSSGQTLVFFNWTLDNNVSCEPVKFWYSNEEGVGPFQYGLNPNSLDFAVYAGNGQMPPNWEVEHYGQIEFADGSLSDTIFYTPTACIPGCTDPNQASYNPWATVDDGTCSGTACDTATQYQITIEITLDNWPGETGWSFVDGMGNTFNYPSGTYNFQDIGQVYTYDFCVDQNAAFEMIISDTYGDGMAGSTAGGSMDGSIVIYSCTGDTIWYMDNPGFGNTLYSSPQTATPCATTPVILGCTDDDYVEFNPLANVDDGSCATAHIYGCTDSTAFNYDATATMMDLIPDCDYELWLGDAGGDGWGNSYLGVMQNGLIIGTYTIGPGSYQQTWNIILDPAIPVEVFYFEIGGPQQPPQEVEFQTWHNSFKLTNADGYVLMHEGQNPFSNNGQGALQGFGSPFWTKYVAIPFCGNYCEPFIYGCMDTTAINYDSMVNTDDGSCYYQPGCMSSAYLEYYTQGFVADFDDNSCQTLAIWGCTDSTMYNYDPAANISNGGCVPFVYGCMDPTAFNYDSLATAPDTCIAYYYGCTDPTAFNYDSLANTDDGSCFAVVLGCMDVTAFNYNALANTDDGSCIPMIFGCIDPTMWNYCDTCNTDNGSCIEYIYGCTDSLALNYNDDANTDNGSCIYPMFGCTDPTALNYDPMANMSDSTCEYSAGCAVGDVYTLPNECFAWVIEVDEYCCDVSWDSGCISLYNYCIDGWSGPTYLIELRDDLVTYPNPTSDYIYVNKKVDLTIVNMLGDIVISEKDINVLDVSKLSPGIYNVLIEYNKLKINKKIIKQ